MSAEVKILFVIISPVVGGAELHTIALAGGLAERGFAVSIFAINDGSEASRFGALVPGSANVSQRQRIRDLRMFIEAEKIDLVVGVNEQPILFAYLARFGAAQKPKLIGVFHSTSMFKRREYLRHFLFLPMYYSIDRVIFLCRAQRRFFANLLFWPRNFEIILNGVNIDYFSDTYRMSERQAARRRLNFGSDDIVIALCAVFRSEKNHLLFLETLARLKAQGMAAKGLLIGDGPLRPAIEARIRSLSLGASVVITGFCEDVRPYVAAADIGLNCSATETISLSALEMLAMGLPMAMSDSGGSGEIVDDRNGVLFPPNDIGALQNAIVLLLDPARRSAASSGARARAVREFNQSTMFDRYAAAFRDILSVRVKSA